MNKFVGVIKRLGNAITNEVAHKYTVVEIGDKVIQNKFVSNGLVNYLEQAVASGESVSLWVLNHQIVAIKLANQKTYATKYKIGWKNVVALVLSIPLMIILIGFVIAAFLLGKMISAARANSKIAGIGEPNMIFLETAA